MFLLLYEVWLKGGVLLYSSESLSVTMGCLRYLAESVEDERYEHYKAD